MQSYFNPCSLRESPKQELIQPTSCLKCGNKHVGYECAANITFFEWKHPAHDVYLVGEWSKWQHHEHLKKLPDGTFRLGRNLRIGFYQYKFIVDGQWTYDPTQSKVPDNYGLFNNLKEVYPTTAYTENQNVEGSDTKIVSSINDPQLKIIGSWDNWSSVLSMKLVYNHLKNCQEYTISLKLDPGKKYEFKFISKDNRYLIDSNYPAISNNIGGLNNWLVVSYGSGMETPKVKMSKKDNKQINTKEWSWTKQPMEDFPYYNIYGHRINVIGEYIYLVGGNDKGCYKNSIIKISVDSYVCEDVETFDEEEFPSRAFHHAKVYGNKLLIYGGIGAHVMLYDYLSYNTSTKQWNFPPKIKGVPPQNRQKNSCVLFKDMFIFFGGYLWTSDLEFQSIYNDIAVLDLTEMKWISNLQVQGAKPKARYAHSATLYNQYMYVFGGVINPTDILSINDVWKLKLISQEKLQWEEVKMSGKPPVPRYGHSASLLGQWIIIVAGMGDKSVMLNDVVFLDVKTASWVHPLIGGDIPKPRYFHAAAVLNEEEVIVLGGKTTKGGKNENAYILKPNYLPKVLQF